MRLISESKELNVILRDMRPFSLKHRLLALVLGALVVGLAPIVHAFCVAPSANATSSGVSSAMPVATTMTHTMADGNTMVMAVQSTVVTEPATKTFMPHAVSATTLSSAHSSAVTVETSLVSTLGSIFIAVGLAILTFFGIRRCAQLRAAIVARSRASPPRRDRWPEKLTLRPYAVSLDSLGISRT